LETRSNIDEFDKFPAMTFASKAYGLVGAGKSKCLAIQLAMTLPGSGTSHERFGNGDEAP
jgi:hypothetical protein